LPLAVSDRRARAWNVGQPPRVEATAITSPTPKKVGCRKLGSPMIASSTTIQIV
jgi:hypothetical protein